MPQIALQVLLAMALGSAAVAKDGHAPRWSPGKRSIEKLDFAFRAAPRWHGAPPDLDGFFRYYAAVTVKGRHMIRAEFTTLPNSFRLTHGGIELYQDGPSVRITLVDQFPKVADGGYDVLNMLFDVDAGRMVWLRCGG